MTFFLLDMWIVAKGKKAENEGVQSRFSNMEVGTLKPSNLSGRCVVSD